ncbi:MAG TPA: hypothetical protein VEX35_04115 [Allosphingosinicella sp.]|nr:hypothetical protein [Allosphingosinicella sp.]
MKPQDFTIGIRDFFAILVPGAIVLFILPRPDPQLFGPSLEALDVIALAIVAYLIGSVADKLGAILDLPPDHFLRSKHLPFFSKRLAARKMEAEECQRQLLKDCVPPVPSHEPTNSTRVFWWDQLRLDCPAAIQELDRIEAAQKLFRSLTAASFVLAVYEKSVSAPEWRLFEGALDHAAWWLLLAGLISAALYVAGRFAFFAAVCRLAVAYTVHRRSTLGAAPETAP